MTMRIAQMLDTLYWGGAQKMQLFLIETLQPLGVELTVISLRESSDSPVIAKLQEAGARVVTFPFPKLFSPGSFFRLVMFLRAEKFDLLHAYLTYSNIIGPIAGALAGTPTIASIRNADFEKKDYNALRGWLEITSIRYFASRVMANGIAVAKYTRQRLNNRRKVDIIPNAVDFVVPVISDSERIEIRTEISTDPNRPIILSVGRLTPAKGFFDLLEAFAIVQKHYAEAVLVIAGRGKLLEPLTTRIGELGLAGSVFLLGMRSDVPRLLAAADIYVNASHWEGTPVSVLEAMAAGLPIVATSVGETPYLLDENAGILAPAHQPQMLAAGLISLLDSGEKRVQLGRAARERIRHYYSREIWRKSMLDLYSEITPKASVYLAGVAVSNVQNGEA
jgi:glycosyltransferase involved in cell wall biosynthesis